MLKLFKKRFGKVKSYKAVVGLQNPNNPALQTIVTVTLHATSKKRHTLEVINCQNLKTWLEATLTPKTEAEPLHLEVQYHKDLGPEEIEACEEVLNRVVEDKYGLAIISKKLVPGQVV